MEGDPVGDQPTTSILAIVTTAKENVSGGGAPIFIAHSKEELQKFGVILSKVLDSSAHELNPDTIVIVNR